MNQFHIFQQYYHKESLKKPVLINPAWSLSGSKEYWDNNKPLNVYGDLDDLSFGYT